MDSLAYPAARSGRLCRHSPISSLHYRNWLAANMRHAGVLRRIDHVMGLTRLFVIQTAQASEGRLSVCYFPS